MDLISVLWIAIPAAGGLLLAFNGYKLLRISLSLVGAVVGFFLGRAVVGAIPADMTSTTQWIIIGVFAIGLGAISFGLYEKAVFLIGAAGGAFFTWSLYPVDAAPGISKWIIVILAAIACGLAVKFINEWALKLFTSFFGARLIGFALTALMLKFDLLSTAVSSLTLMIFKTPDIPSEVAVSGLCLVTFGIWGFFHQLKK